GERRLPKVQPRPARAAAEWPRRGLLSLLAGGDQLFDVDQLGGVVAGVAGVAVFVLLVVGDRLAEGTDGEIADGIGFHETADLLDVVVGGDQLGAGGRIDAVETGRNGGRAGDAYVHFAGAGLAHHADDLAAGGATHDGIVHQHDALALEQVAHRVELELEAEIANG